MNNGARSDQTSDDRAVDATLDGAFAASIEGVQRTQVEVVDEDEPVTRAAQRMRWNNEGVVVVVDENRAPIGILTDRDLALRVIAAKRDPAATCVSDVMTSEVAVLGTEATIAEALDRMAQRLVRRLPIIDRTGRLVGMVTFDDLVRAGWRNVPQVDRILRWAVPLPPVREL